MRLDKPIPIPCLPAVPIALLARLVGRPEMWVLRNLRAHASDATLALSAGCTINDALRLIMRMRSKDGTMTEIHAKFRLSKLTRSAAAMQARNYGIQLEALYVLAAIYTVEGAQGKLLDHSRPELPVRGTQILLRHFCRDTYRALRLIAWATQTTPSAVLDWSLSQYLNSQKEKA